MFKLSADGDVYLGSGDLGVPPFIYSRMVNIKGNNINLKGTGIWSESGMDLIGSEKITLQGPATIGSNLKGLQK